MSADPPRKAYKYTCNMIRPQIYSEKSLMESVVDFFSDVVPQAYTGTQKTEDKEKIQWVRFENCDSNDVAKNPDLFRSDTKGLPLLLILGYSNGVQIWYITPNGEAQEILSIRQGPVRICRILPNPDPVLGNSDSYNSKRPLAVMCDSSSAGQPYCGVKFVSLKAGEEVHSISFKTLPVQNIECNKRFLVIVFLEKVCVHEACQFQQLFWITSCFPCPGPTVNPIALTTRWLAYADKRLVAMHQSCGGMSGDGSQSYAATVISAAKGAFKGLSMFGEAMVNSVTGCKPASIKRDCVQLDNGNRPGIVTVVDIQNIHNDHFNVNEDNEGDGLIAHFHAHANEPVSSMAFDPTGTLLVTACKLGHNFHVFRLMAHPVSSSLGAVHHLYTLHRGETTAKVIDISFNHDSRWITVSSHRGTTHLFPITPYGGPVNIRTHSKPHVVNRASRFHRSAGLDEFDHAVGRRSPVLSTSPSSSGQYDRYPTLIQQNTLNNNMGNPRLPPYPHPITIFPAFQIKQPLNVALNPGNKNQSPSHSPTGFDNVYCVCAKFCTPRLCVIGSPKLDVERRDGGKRPVDSLFVMVQSGTLVEYVLEPRAKSVSDKVFDDCLLELNVDGRMQWNLQRLKNSQELRPPLPSNSPLILANEAVTSQVPTAPDLYDLPGLTRQDSKDSLSSDHSSKDDNDEQWLSQVEIITHAGPHRRLWMGPQFSFKTYQENTTVLSSNSSSLLSQSPESNMAAMDMMGDEGDLESLKLQPTRSNPVSMPNARPAYRRLSGSDSPSTVQGIGAQNVPLLIEAGSFDQSPHLLDVYSNWTESTVSKQPRGSDDLEEDRLKETLADAMVESPCKDLEKLSLRHQDIPRPSVKAEQGRGQAGGKVAVEKSKRVEASPKKIEIVHGKSEDRSCAEEKQDKLLDKSSKRLEQTYKKSGKKNKVEDEKGMIESVAAKKGEEVNSSSEKVEVSTVKSKNGKVKKNSRESSDSKLTNSNTTLVINKKAENDASLGNVKSEKQKDEKLIKELTKTDTAKEITATEITAKEITARENAAKIQCDKNSNTEEKQGSKLGDCSREKDSRHTWKSTATKDENTAIVKSTEIAEVKFDEQKSKEYLKSDCVGNSQLNSQRANKDNTDRDFDVETHLATVGNSANMKAVEKETVTSELESLSKGKSKRKNKKSSKNVMKESVCEMTDVQRDCKFKHSPVTSRIEKSVLRGDESVSEMTAKSPKVTIDEAKEKEKEEMSHSGTPDTEGLTEETDEEVKRGVKLTSLDEDECNAIALSDKAVTGISSIGNFPAQKCKENKNEEIGDAQQASFINKETEKSFESREFPAVTNPKTNDQRVQYVNTEQEEIAYAKQCTDQTKMKENTVNAEKHLRVLKSTSSDNISNKSLENNESKEEFFAVKSKRKNKNKNSGMKNTACLDFAYDNEKQQSTNIKAEDTLKAEKESISKRGRETGDTFVSTTSSSSCLPTSKAETSEEKINTSKTELVASQVGTVNTPVSKEECTDAGKLNSRDVAFELDEEMSPDKIASSHSEKYIHLNEEEKTNIEKLKGETAVGAEGEAKTSFTQESNNCDEQETFVVPKKKNKRKKKYDETKQESCKSSPETEIPESPTMISAKSNVQHKSVDETNIDLDEMLPKAKKVVETKNKVTSKIAEAGYEKKSAEKFKVENEVHQVQEIVKKESFFETREDNLTLSTELTTNMKDEDSDEIIGISDEKRMEDSAESGSKYETAESAEDDPSAWERSEFEECIEGNDSERDTAIESSSSFSYGKSGAHFEEDIYDLSGQDKRAGSDIDEIKKQTVTASKEIKGKEVIESIGKEMGCKKPSIIKNAEQIEETNIISVKKTDIDASAMVMDTYDESAGSSSRSSEEREGIGGGKTASEKPDHKNKKKKRKNKK